MSDEQEQAGKTIKSGMRGQIGLYLAWGSVVLAVLSILHVLAAIVALGMGLYAFVRGEHRLIAFVGIVLAVILPSLTLVLGISVYDLL